VAATHAAGEVAANPPAIRSGSETNIVITATIPADPDLIPTSVQLLRYDELGRVVGQLGQLFDDGTHGDMTPSDHVFSRVITLNEIGPKTVILKTSLAFRGAILRVMSAPLYLPVRIYESPAQAASDLSSSLHSGNRASAYHRLGETFNSRRVLDSLDAGGMSQVADALDQCMVTSSGPSFQVCATNGVFRGQVQSFEFIFAEDLFGIWRVITW
jgi:hypothetical protein